MKDVQFELMLTVALVVMVIFLFLRNLAATVIPSVAVPLVAGWHVWCHVPAGLFARQPVADGADDLDGVRGGRCDRDDREHRSLPRRRAMSPLDAALKGSGQIGFTIISLTVSLIAVLIPLLFMGDIVGRLFREFAVTLSVTILVSAVVSLTLTPMMCLEAAEAQERPEAGPFLHGFGALVSIRSLRSTGTTLTVGVAASDGDAGGDSCDVGADAGAFLVCAEGIFPVQDTGVILGHFRGAADHFVYRDVRAAADNWRR